MITHKLSFSNGVFSIFLGAAVLVGWYTRNEALIQVLPVFAPMQFNTATGFLLAGIGLTTLTFGHYRVSLLCGATVVVLGVLTLAQYLTGLDLRIDELFMEAYIMVKTSDPGRMAPNTALCFALSGLALILFSLQKFREAAAACAELFCFTVLGLAVMAFISYLLGPESDYGWMDLTRMAVHTALGFLILAIGLLDCVWKEEKSAIVSIPLWVPVGVLMAIVSVEFFTPLGVAAGVLYVPFVVCSLWFNREYMPFVFAGVASLLILSGYFISPDQTVSELTVLVNRGISLLAVWVTAVIVALQKYTRIKLEAAHSFQNLILDAIPDLVFVKDEKLRIVQANDSFIEAYPEDKRDKVIGYTTLEDYSPEQVATITKNDRDAFTEGYNEVEETINFPDGTTRVLATKKTRFSNDHDFFILGIARDITSIKRSQRQLLQANKELEKFAYIASHDLKAPLRGIDNLAAWISDDLQDAMDEDTKERMALLRARVKRLEAMLVDILEYSRVGRVLEAPQSIDLNELLEEIVGALDVPEGFEVSLRDDMPVIFSPRTPLEQIFINVVCNAIKHHDRDQGQIDVSWKSSGSMIEFTVQDDGPGIPAEFQDRVFDMFQTLKPRDVTEGTGLGMSIIQKLVEWQGGTVEIESPGEQRGTLIRFTWPRIYREMRSDDEQ